jgi:hypothetical protein
MNIGYVSSPIVLAIAMFILADIVLFLALVLCDSMSRWKLYFLASAILAITVPTLVFLGEVYKEKEAEFKGGYESPPVDFYKYIEFDKYER